MTFVESVNIPECRGAFRGNKWFYSCGLELGNTVGRIKASHYSRKQSGVMSTAHRNHHDSLDTDYVRGANHDARATLYYTDGTAWCSCGYDPFDSRRR